MDKYPTLHPKNEEGITLPPMCGTWCPVGWEDIVDKLCGCIVDYTTLTYTTTPISSPGSGYEKIYPPPVIIDQIKSKFAGLRFYYSGGDEQVAGIVRFAEHMCNNTCEVTGKPGKKHQKGYWLMTLCDEEIEKLNK